MAKLDELSVGIGRIEQKVDDLLEGFNNHLKHHDDRDKWMWGVISALIVGVILMAIKAL